MSLSKIDAMKFADKFNNVLFNIQIFFRRLFLINFNNLTYRLSNYVSQKKTEKIYEKDK